MGAAILDIFSFHKYIAAAQSFKRCMSLFSEFETHQTHYWKKNQIPGFALL